MNIYGIQPEKSTSEILLHGRDNTLKKTLRDLGDTYIVQVHNDDPIFYLGRKHALFNNKIQKEIRHSE